MKEYLTVVALCALSSTLAANKIPPPAKAEPKPAKTAPNIKKLEVKPAQVAPADRLRKLLQQRMAPGARPQLVRPIPQLGGAFGRVPARPSTTTAIPALKSQKQVEAVHLLNGDVLQGKFVSFNDKSGLVWRHPNIKPDLQVDPAQIARVTFAPNDKAAAKPMRSRVALANGDQLAGDLTELTDKQLLLNTWYAGSISIDRKAVRTLVPGETPLSVIYEGPRDAKGWVFSNSNQVGLGGLPQRANLPPAALEQMKARASAKWDLKENSFHSSGSGAQVGREFPKMGDKANIEFDVAWGGSLSLYVNLLTDNLKSYSMGNTYCLRLSQTSAYMYKYENRNGQRRSSRIGDTVRYNLNSLKQSAHISIRLDRTKKLIVLIINGKQVGKWNDTGKFAGKGKGLLFSARTTYPIRLSSIQLSEWDGQLPADVKVTTESLKEDFIQLANDDTLTGKLVDIKRGQMNFKPEFSDAIPIPLMRVNLIRLADSKASPAVAESPVRATLKGRGQITATLKEWKDGKLHLTSPTFGETTIDTNAVESIQFNLDKSTQTASLPTPTKPQTNTRININGLPIPINGRGRLNLNINGARIEVLPQKGGLRIEQKIAPKKIAPKRR
jgi:hypothetical protein